MLKLSTGH